MGHSAGAHLVSLVATDGRRLGALGKPLSIIRGVIALDTNAYDLSQASRFHKGVFGDDPAVWHDASPISHVAVNKGIPPFLVCYSRGMGANLNPARPAQARAFADTLKNAGINAEWAIAGRLSNSRLLRHTRPAGLHHFRHAETTHPCRW